MKKLIISCLFSISSIVFAGGVSDDPLLTKIMGEVESSKNSTISLNIQAWASYDLNKLWLKLEKEKVGNIVENNEIQLLYSKAIAPFWDLQFGLRKDSNPGTVKRDYAVIAFKGLAPYLFDIDASLFLGKNSQIAFRLEAEYEYMFTQKLILTPSFGFNIYSKDDLDIDIGGGLSDISMGLRLRYEFRREFAPYIGISWSKDYGKTLYLLNISGESVKDFRGVIGVRLWFE